MAETLFRLALFTTLYVGFFLLEITPLAGSVASLCSLPAAPGWSQP